MLSIDIHDGVPYAPIWGPTDHTVVGNFMTWIDTWGAGYIVQRIWFYHGGDYEDSGVPYEVHYVYRVRYEGGIEVFYEDGHFERTTTCNFCWEEIDVHHWNAAGGSNEEQTFGVFIRPLAGGAAEGPQPMLWMDRQADTVHLSALLDLNFSPTPGVAAGPSGRDAYYLIGYYSDYGLGEVLLGVEIESDVIVAAEPMSFSAVKSLY